MSLTGVPANQGSTAAAPDPVAKVIADVEHDVEIVVEKVEAAWTWVEHEFTYLKHEAAVLYDWVSSASPELQSLMHAAMQTWEAAAAKLADAGTGYLSNIIAAEGATIETGVANFAQGVLGEMKLPDNLTPGIGTLFAHAESLLVAMVQTAIPKVLAAIVAPAP